MPGVILFLFNLRLLRSHFKAIKILQFQYTRRHFLNKNKNVFERPIKVEWILVMGFYEPVKFVSPVSMLPVRNGEEPGVNGENHLHSATELAANIFSYYSICPDYDWNPGASGT